jgi:hypothetical protein
VASRLKVKSIESGIISLDANNLGIDKPMMVNIGDNKQGYLFVVSKSNGYVSSYSTPIVNIDGSLHIENALKFHSYLDDEYDNYKNYKNSSISSIVKDNDALYVVYTVSIICMNYGTVYSSTITKYKLPNFDIDWEKEFFDSNIISMAINDDEIALFNMCTGKITFLNKNDGSNKDVESIDCHDKTEHTSLFRPGMTGHDLHYFKEYLLAASLDNKIKIYDGKNHQEVSTWSSYEEVTLIDIFENLKYTRNVQIDNLNDRMYILDKGCLIVYTPNNCTRIPIYEYQIDDINLDKSTGNLLLMVSKDKLTYLINLSNEQIERYINKEKRVGSTGTMKLIGKKQKISK